MHDQQSLENRLDALALDLRQLTERVDRLAAHLRSSVDAGGAAQARTSEPVPAVASTSGPVSDEVLTWASRAVLLPRMATLCFLLVVALALRSIAEYSPGFKQPGAVVGMVYAAALMLVGWSLYARSHRLAAVFAATGAMLMSVIVVEVQLRFRTLDAAPAYGLIVLTGGFMAFMSRHFRSFTPISVGILGMCLAGVIIGWPDPYFPGMAMVLLAANLLGWLAAGIKRCSWLRWTALAVSMFMIYFLWGYKVESLLRSGQQPAPRLAASLLLPVLGLFAVVFAGLALAGLLRRNQARASRFDLALPVINVVWAFTAAAKVTAARHESLVPLGVIGALGTLLHLAAAWLLARRERAGRSGAGAFALAGAALLAMALPHAAGGLLIALPLLSAVALGLAVAADRWASRAVRWVGVLLQVYVSVALSHHLWGNERFTASALGAGAAAVPAVVGFAHYRFATATRSARDAGGGGRAADGDPGPVVLLLAALLAAFFALRVGLYQALLRLPVDMGNSFPCAQTILISASAALLMLIALARRNREIRNAAILVTLIAGFRLVFRDLLSTHGVPLTASVFTFGVVAAIESVAIGRWARRSRAGPDSLALDGGYQASSTPDYGER